MKFDLPVKIERFKGKYIAVFESPDGGWRTLEHKNSPWDSKEQAKEELEGDFVEMLADYVGARSPAGYRRKVTKRDPDE